MIESFKCKETDKLFQRRHTKRLPQSIHKVAMRKLWMLDAAVKLSDLKIPPNNQLEALKTGKDSTVYGSTSNGVFASSGNPDTQQT